MATLSEEIVSGVSGAISPLHQRYVTQDTLLKEWGRTEVRCVRAARTPQRAGSLMRRLRDSWQHMVRDRATRTLTYNDEQFHVLERMKVIRPFCLGHVGRCLQHMAFQACILHFILHVLVELVIAKLF